MNCFAQAEHMYGSVNQRNSAELRAAGCDVHVINDTLQRWF